MQNNLGFLLTKRAYLSPELDAVVEVERGRRFSYSELNRRCNRVAHALMAQGVRPGDRVAVLLLNEVECLETYFAIAKIGAVAVPLNMRLVPDELAFILQDSGAATLLYDPELEPLAGALSGRGLGIKTWIRVGGASPLPPFAVSYEALTAQASAEEPPLVAGDDSLLFILYTSGTTGRPKGAMHSHRNMVAASFTLNMTGDVRYRDRYLHLLPLFHIAGLVAVIAIMHRGGSLVITRAFDPALVFKTIEAEAINFTVAVPTMLRFMLSVPNRGKLSTLRWIMAGGAPVPVPLIQAYSELGIEVHQMYGLTEGGPVCMISPEHAMTKAGSTGRAFFHTRVRVVNDAGQPVAPGELGEVLVAGEHVMQGYWNAPEATAEVIRDGWLHTGDLATVDEEGFVYIKDRKKDLIISGGENIYPAELENILAAHPKLKDVAVIGVPSAKWGESPAAIVVPKPDETVTPAEVIEFCRGKIAAYKLPKVVEFTKELPRNSTGKVVKYLLRQQFPGPTPE